MDNPIAMPYPYGNTEVPRGPDRVIWDSLHTEEYQKMINTELNKLLYGEGMEDCGDTLSRQVGGTHYKKGVQPWTIAMDWGLDPWSHNVIKYILRFPYKNGKEDLEKIQHYLEFLIENYDEVKTKYYK